MRKYIATITMMFLVAVTGSIMAQNINFTEESVVYDGKERMSISITMAPPADDVKQGIERWIKDKYDVKLKGTGLFANKDVLSAEETRIPVISSNMLDFYARAVPAGEMTKLNVFASFGYNVHIAPEKYPDEFAALRKLTYEFVSEFLPNWYEERITEMEDTVSDLSDEVSSLKGDIDDNLKEQEKLRKELEELNATLSTTEESLSKKLVNLERYKADLERVNRDLKRSGNMELQ
ncbi:MAG: hypothetical protein R3301_03170 [Saprospiraceae bacterium]|nr:hypothetical protein [Saprospiraceae bacterium]